MRISDWSSDVCSSDLATRSQFLKIVHIGTIMPKLAANITMMFNEVPFLERIQAAAQAGFKAVEFLFPYEHEAHAIAGELSRHGVKNVLFNMPPGDWNAGERTEDGRGGDKCGGTCRTRW